MQLLRFSRVLRQRPVQVHRLLSRKTGAGHHYAKVEDMLNDPEFLPQMDRIRMFPERSDKSATVIMLGELIELDTPVESDGQWIQGAMYRDIDQVLSMRRIPELL